MLYAQTEGREYQGRRYNGIRMDGIYRSVYIRRERSLDKNFIRSRNEIVLDGYTADRSLRIVAWGNVNALGEKQSVSEAQTIEDLKVMLKSQDGLAVYRKWNR